MASTKAYLEFILEQLSDIPGLTYRPMIGEYLLYSDGTLFGGIYDDRLLIKKSLNINLDLPEVLPYDGAKTPMYFIENVDDKSQLTEIIAKIAPKK